MTDDMQRARELLAAECTDRAASLEKSAASDRETSDSIQEAIDSGEGITPGEPQDVAAGLLNDAERAEETAGLLRRVAAALRAAPEGLVLVPVDLRTGAGYEVWEAGIRVRYMGGSVEEMWAAMLAARPQGGEGC